MRTYAVILLGAWIVGMALGVLSLPWVLVLLAVVGSFLVRWRLQQSLPFCVAVSLVLWLGGVYGQDAGSALTADPCAVQSPLTGVIAERPVVSSNSVRYRVTDDQKCSVLVTASAETTYYEGDHVLIEHGKIQAVGEIPAEYQGYARYLRRQGIAATWRFPVMTLQERQLSRSTKAFTATRASINELFGEPDASLTAALLIGDTGSLPDSIQNTYRATGVNHILSISGLHISFLAGILLAIALLMPLTPRWRTAAILLVLTLYVVFIGAPIAAVRALLFWALVLLGLRTHRLVALPTLFICAAVVLVTIDPLLLTDISFQLSFGAVLGMFLIVFLFARVTHDLKGLRKAVVSSLLISVGATLTTWPLVAYYFGTISFISPLANLLIVPLSTLVVITGFVALGLYWLIPILGYVVAAVVHGLIVLMNGLAAGFAAVPFAYLTEVHPPTWFIGCYYIALLGICLVVMRYQQRSWREVWQ